MKKVHMNSVENDGSFSSLLSIGEVESLSYAAISFSFTQSQNINAHLYTRPWNIGISVYHSRSMQRMQNNLNSIISSDHMYITILANTNTFLAHVLVHVLEIKGHIPVWLEDAFVRTSWSTNLMYNRLVCIFLFLRLHGVHPFPLPDNIVNKKKHMRKTHNYVWEHPEHPNFEQLLLQTFPILLCLYLCHVNIHPNFEPDSIFHHVFDSVWWNCVGCCNKFFEKVFNCTCLQATIQ